MKTLEYRAGGDLQHFDGAGIDLPESEVEID